MAHKGSYLTFRRRVQEPKREDGKFKDQQAA